MEYIKNYKELLSNISCTKCKRARKIVLDILNIALEEANPRKALHKSLRKVGRKTIDIHGKKFRFKNLYLIGFGKASGGMAKAVEEILGEDIDKGIVVVPENLAYSYNLKYVKVIASSHPIPDERSIKAGNEIAKLVQEACSEDLVLVLISGGGSALVEILRPQITLKELEQITNLLLKSGASIKEINTVRKHLSLFKGGWLAKRIYPATTVSLIISDVVGDPVEFIASGPTAPDTTTFKDALRVMEKYNLIDKASENVIELFKKGVKGEVIETPKPLDKVFKNVHNFVIASNKESLMKAAKYAKEKIGLNVLLLTSRIRGEARHVGTVLASILEETYKDGFLLKKPFLLLAGGETTVTVTGKGKGGRNQELALSAAKIINGLDGVAFASIGSDGIDGVTEVAGGLVDAHTVERVGKENLSIDSALKDNDSYTIFKVLKDYIYTGPTGTNVNDFMVGVVLNEES